MPAGSSAALDESPAEAAAMGDLAFYREVPPCGSCQYTQPSPMFLPEAGTGLSGEPGAVLTTTNGGFPSVTRLAGSVS